MVFKNKKEAEAGKKEKKIDLNKYQDPTGVTIEKLERALWFFQNRKNFKKSFVILLILFCIIVWSYALYGYGKYLIIGMDRDKKLAEELTETNIFHNDVLQFSPKTIVLSDLEVIRENDKYDFVIKIINPNDYHVGYFNYCFTSNGDDIKCGGNFILPEEEKYIIELSNEIKGGGGQIGFEIKKLNWKKIDRHEINNWGIFENKRINFEIKNAEITPPQKSKLSEEINLSNLSFSVANNSAFGYYKIPFNILLLNNNKIVAVNKFSVYNFKSKEKRNIDITWTNLNFVNGTIKIIPEVDISSEDVYMNLDASPKEIDTRETPIK